MKINKIKIIKSKTSKRKQRKGRKNLKKRNNLVSPDTSKKVSWSLAFRSFYILEGCNHPPGGCNHLPVRLFMTGDLIDWSVRELYS